MSYVSGLWGTSVNQLQAKNILDLIISNSNHCILNDLTAKNECTFVHFPPFVAQLLIKKSITIYYSVVQEYGKPVEFKYY